LREDGNHGSAGSGGLRTVALAAAVMLFLGAQAHAEKVGVAAAVNPDAFSSLSGAPKSQLNIGKSIFYNERINTTGSGVVQVLLVDGSTFTVGPDSDLVIDKFVYDPKKGTGQIAASFSKGVMRFVGGKISKQEDAVTVNMPAGTLGIRGAITLVKASGRSATVSLVYGVRLKFKAFNGRTFDIWEPGYTLVFNGGQGTVRVIINTPPQMDI